MNDQSAHYFLAIPLPGKVRELLSNHASTLKTAFPYKKWTHSDDYHITLAFLGAAGFQQVNELKKTVTESVGGHPSFSIQLNEMGTFGKKEQPRVLWAGVKAPPELFGLQKKVYNACVSAGFELDKRPYTPHITLAKSWTGTETMDRDRIDFQLEPLTWQVNGIVLYRIQIKQIPKYQPLKIFEF